MLNTELSMQSNLNNSLNQSSPATAAPTSGQHLKPIAITSLRLSRRALELMLQKAELFLEQSPTLNQALKEVTYLLATNLPVAFCRISLTESGGQSLIPQAAYSSLPDFQWNPQLNKSLPLALLPDGLRLSHLYYSLVGPRREVLAREQLRLYSQELGLREPLAKLLLVPLRIGSRFLAVIELGELSDDLLEGMNETETQAIILQAPRFAAPLSERLKQLQIG